MLRISDEQIAALEVNALESFRGRVMAHLREFFPELALKLDKASVNNAIERVAERAGRYGIVSEQGICGFLDLVLVFGWDFDVKLVWARKYLLEPGYGDPDARLNLVFAAGIAAAGAASASK